MSVRAAEALFGIGGVQFRPAEPVRFKSGILSPVYCDARTLPFYPEAWRTVIAEMQSLVRELGLRFDVVGGVETAAIPHSAAFAFAMGVPSVFIRKTAKEHGTKRRVEGGDVAGKRVLLIEDVVTTGGSSLSGVDALRAEGAEVTDCLAIIRYGFLEATERFANADVAVHSLTTFDQVLAVAAKSGAIAGAEEATVRDWLHDPHGWAQRAAQHEPTREAGGVSSR